MNLIAIITNHVTALSTQRISNSIFYSAFTQSWKCDKMTTVNMKQRSKSDDIHIRYFPSEYFLITEKFFLNDFKKCFNCTIFTSFYTIKYITNTNRA